MSKRSAFLLLVGLASIGLLIAPSAAWLLLTGSAGAPMSYSGFLYEVGADAVDRITQDDHELTVLIGGERFLVVVPDNANLTADLSAVAASHTGAGGVAIDTTVDKATPVAPWLRIALTGFLPLVLVAGLLVWARSVLRRDPPRAGSSASALSKSA